jgi:hypothetical protein
VGGRRLFQPPRSAILGSNLTNGPIGRLLLAPAGRWYERPDVEWQVRSRSAIELDPREKLKLGGTASEPRLRARRAAIVLLALACLTTGVWGGLVRLYWTLVPLTSFNVHWVTYHGPLMMGGFLGTLIGVERATALGRWWGYAGPLLTAAGALTLACGVGGGTGPLLILLGSLAVVLVTCVLFLRQPSLDLGLLVGGTAAWLVGNLLWFQAWQLPETIHQIVVWWFGFLLFTVFAERLELSRVLAISSRQRGIAAVSVAVYLVGLLTRPSWPLGGERIMGTAMVVMAAWLFRNDVARRTIRRGGLARYIAVSLLCGYAWLGIVGIGLWMHEPLPRYGVLYDSILHAFFLGFVVSMIFAHAPIILEAVIGVAPRFSRWYYLPLILLHASLLVRIIGDILAAAALPSWTRIHGWGGTFNAVAIALFFATIAVSVLSSAVPRGADPMPLNTARENA